MFRSLLGTHRFEASNVCLHAEEADMRLDHPVILRVELGGGAVVDIAQENEVTPCLR